MAFNKRVLTEIDRQLKDRNRSKKYSKSLSATNKLFMPNYLFHKPSRTRIYDPNAEFFQKGGPTVKERRGARENYGYQTWTPSGLKFPMSESSHLMRTEYIPGRGWVSFPTLFQDSKPYADDQQNWIDMSWEEDWTKVYEEAERRGEVYDFGEDKEAALAFGEGSWKDQLLNKDIELELTDEEIQKYVDGGYIVEDLPKAQKGIANLAGKAAKNIKSKSNIIESAVPKKPFRKLALRSLNDRLTGLDRGVSDLLKTDRKFTEVFPITKSQKEGVKLLQEEAMNKGVEFVDDWFYKFDPNFGKILRPEISDKILDIYEQANPRDRSSRFFYERFRPEGGGKFNLGTIWDEYDHRALTPIDNTPVYGVETAGINQSNPFVYTKNMLRGNTRDILNDDTLTDIQKEQLVYSRAKSSALGTNYSSNPNVRLSVTDYKRGPYRIDPKDVYKTALHETAHTSQDLGMPGRGWGDITTKYDPKKGYHYPNEDTPIGRFYKSIMPDKHWVGSPNELHSELMVARSKLYDKLKNKPEVKEYFKTDFNSGKTLGIPERDEKIKEWAFSELRNPSNQMLDDLIDEGNLNRFFKEGVSREKKYDALRYLPGLAVPFALPGLMDDDKPKAQFGKIVKYLDRKFYPKRAYRVSPANLGKKNIDYTLDANPLIAAKEKNLIGKIEKKGDWFTTDLNEARQYLQGDKDRAGIFAGDDMVLTETKIPFWKKNILADDDVVTLKQLQGAALPGQPRGYYQQVINENEFIIPRKSFFYPKRSNTIKAVPESVINKPNYIINPLGEVRNLGGKNSFTLNKPFQSNDAIFGHPAYSYLEDQLNAITGQEMPLFLEGKFFQDAIDKNLDPYNVKSVKDSYVQPEFAPNEGVGDFKELGGPLELGDEVTEDMVEELRKQGYTLEEI